MKDGEKQKPRFLLFDSQKSQGRVFQSFRKYQLGFVPPTVNPSMRSVGWPTPTGTCCPSFPQVPT
ncbi:MAG: hypothetical protein ACREYC_15565, partial [Gammaproteobacteria bacterium]